METKILEIRDEGTFIPILAIDMNPSIEARGVDTYYLRRCGYTCDGAPNIAITRLDMNGSPAWYDPYGWGGRTFPVAHNYIIENWDNLQTGDVVDVSYILGETATPKRSERETDR